VIQTALSPIWVILLVAWKLFDVFLIGTIQAFIFMLLTIIYFVWPVKDSRKSTTGGNTHATN